MYIHTTETRDTLCIKIKTGDIRRHAANQAEYNDLMLRVAELVARAAVLDLDIRSTILPWRA